MHLKSNGTKNDIERAHPNKTRRDVMSDDKLGKCDYEKYYPNTQDVPSSCNGFH
jgi:hypothetical protein